ncbi:hypothetical protein ABH945_003687 [Paraburkholderia sp. GAS333]|uniref:Ig-like domain-containing protein n=1 Tax=Paraburkholderia sp. GAS333 TaxID=3156279 RepID=UPI003D258CEA
MSKILDFRREMLGIALLTLLAGCGGGSSDATTSSTAIAVTNVSVAPTSVTLALGNSGTFAATVTPADATDAAVTWTSSDATVATVSGSGVATCVAQGSSTIKASTANGQEGDGTLTCEKPFSVLEFLKLKSYQDSTGVHSITDAWFGTLGISPLNLIYSSNLVTCPLTTCTDEYEVDATKVAAEAASADSTGSTPVSLDLEVWDSDRFTPTVATGNGKTIVQNLSDAVSAFKADNPGAVVGLYAEVPQNTFTWSATSEQTYDSLNPQYASVAALVDYYSPSLYNYGYDGTASGDATWNSAAVYAVDQSRAFDTLNGTSKKVLPYITPVWTDSTGTTHILTYDQMMYRLNALKAAGADGCILWISSEQIDPSTGVLLVIDTTAGWFKAVVDFKAANL